MHASESHRNGGFTLIEILIVVVILGILAAIVLPRFTDASINAKNVATRTQMSTLRGTIERYRYKNLGADPVMTDWSAMIGSGLLRIAPENPMNGFSAIAGAAGAGVGWVWRAKSGSNPNMQLYATGEDPSIEFVE